ncbi:MAG: GNAT family N-acetyltransferase [Ardenticatenaceae bacterium]|nr:GNAT family N-acetyltransferase [Ardenticatenaceae bacterium]
MTQHFAVAGGKWACYPCGMSDLLNIMTVPTEALAEAARTVVIHLCIAAHESEDFQNLFTYIPAGGRHILAYQGAELVGHAVVTTRWVQPAGQPFLRTAYVDAVSVSPAHQGQGIGSALMRHLVTAVPEYEIACLETERLSFYTHVGWEEWQGPLAGRQDGELIPLPEQTGIMIYRLPRTPPLALSGLLTIEFDGRFW